jgi:hypothetical protein
MTPAEIDFVVWAIFFVADHGHKFLPFYRCEDCSTMSDKYLSLVVFVLKGSFSDCDVGWHYDVAS